MPTEIPLIRRITETGYYGAVVYLDTDAVRFWSVVRRHALNNLEPLYGGRYIYSAMPHDATQVLVSTVDRRNEVIPSLNEHGTFIWLDDYYESKHPQPVFRYWHGARLAWEMIGENRLRVVLSSGDLISNLNMAWNILNTIRRIYPESHNSLSDIDGLIESWAYDEETREKWREQVEKRKEWATRDAAFDSERKAEVNQNISEEATAANEDPIPGLGERATREQWFEWFKWYYRQVWGAKELSSKIEHMSHLNGKSKSQNASMHAEFNPKERL